MLQRVLVPLNFHESTAMVLDMCQYLKNFGTNEILLLHVGSDNKKSSDKNQKKLRLYAQELEKIDFKTSLFTRSGSTQIETIKLAEKENAHYISIPFKKKNLLSYALLGSRVKDIIRQSDIPVFVYRKKNNPEDIFRVLFAVSIKGEDKNLAMYIKHNDFQADMVYLVHAGKRAPDPFVEKQRQDMVEKYLKDMQNMCSLNDKKGESISLIGSPRKEILRTARKISANLVLMGKADTDSDIGPVLGSTVEDVSYNAPCSVLIVPTMEDRE